MNKSSLRTGVTIALTMLALYLICFVSQLAFRASAIEEIVYIEQTQKASDSLAAFVKVHETLSDDATQEELLWAYQMAMTTNDDSMEGSYPVRSASFLLGLDVVNQPVVQSRNALFVEINWKDGTESKIPMVFRHENTADVAQVLKNATYVNYQAQDDYVDFIGYWQDGLFYLEELSAKEFTNFEYHSPDDSPEPVETIRVSKENASTFSVTPVMKSLGTDRYYASYADEWEATDKMITKLLSHVEGDTVQGYRVRQSALFQRWEIRFSSFKNYGGVIGSQKSMRYCYVASFNPVVLAFEELTGEGTPLLELVLFGLAAVVLIYCCNTFQSWELRDYQDEIQRQKQALEYARSAEQSRREMTSAIAHELKTPIAVLSSYSEALQENIDAEKQTHYLSVIREETDKMDRMVLELLDLSRLEAGKYKLQRENFDLQELVQEILLPLESQIQEKQLVISYQIGNPQVNADRYRMGQVVENFMTNAIRHTPEGGKILLRIGAEGETFSVENQGRAIPQEQLSKVWETFWQGDASRNKRGSGLGLAICRTIITLHGGSCKVENTGMGVRFSVSLAPDKKLYQLGKMPQEEVIQLDVPIAQWYITVDRLMDRLKLMSRAQLRQELREGNIRMGNEVIGDRRTKLYPGQTLFWQEYRINICRNATDMDRSIIMERMRPNGLWNPAHPSSWVGRP